MDPLTLSPSRASLPKRLASYVFDRATLYLFFKFVAAITISMMDNDPYKTQMFLQWSNGLVAFFITLLVWSLMCIGFESSTWMATPGKRYMGCQVVNLHGGRLSLGQAAVRFVASLLNWITLGLLLFVPLLRKDRRTVQDLIARTQVVNDNPQNTRLRAMGWLLSGLGAMGMLWCLALVVWAGTQAMHPKKAPAHRIHAMEIK